MVILTIFITWFVNRTFLSNYYMFYKMNNLDKAYQEIATIYNNSNNKEELTEKDTIQLEKLSSKYSADIYVFDSYGGILFPSQGNIGDREKRQMLLMFAEYIVKLKNPDIINRKTLEQTDYYYIFSLYDTQKESSYVDLVGYINRTFAQVSDATQNDAVQG